MNIDEAVMLLLVAQGIGSILMLVFSKWVLQRSARSLLQEAINTIFKEPATKHAMSVIGTKSGEVRHESAQIELMAKDIMNSPKLGGLKMAGKALGLDLDEYIEQNGAVDTLKNLQGLGNAIGIDFMNLDLGKLMSGDLNASGAGVTGTNNPYLK